MRRITVEHDDIALRYTRSETDAFHWSVEVRYDSDDKWRPMPKQSLNLTGHDVLWELSSFIVSNLADS